MQLTIDGIADFITERHEADAVAFINERAPRLYCASFSRGTYGRIMAPLIKRYYPRIDLNGQSTALALAITHRLEDKGYKYKGGDGSVRFERSVA